MDVFDTLNKRGFVKQCSNEEALRKKLNEEQLTLYAGFDPTGPSLHAGSLIPLMALAHLQRAGHKPIALIGGGTAMIGDPSGKTEMRKMLAREKIKENGEKIKAQISQVLDFSNASMIDNTDWLTGLNYIDFLRDIGRHFSVNRMLSFEAYKMRLETGLSFIEFNYQILQAYDFFVLHQKYGCRLQVGGDDQWGNIVSGIDLIRRMAGEEAFAITFPLITRADGKKMGKTEKGTLFLAPDMVSPYEFYQYWINVADADVEKFLKLYTFLPLEEIDELAKLKGKEINRAKEILAFELTSLVHGKNEAEKAKSSSKRVFAKDNSADLSAVPSIDVSVQKIEDGIGIIELFALSGLCRSKSEARRLVQQGGAYINNENISDEKAIIGSGSVKDNMILLRAGKKRYFKVNVVSS
jgi:tyrosyl-tRNA synthetase